jgi:hypothetical protein
LNNQNNTYSRLMGMSGEGLQAAGGAGNLISNVGGDIASLYGQKGAAQAAGTIGSANSINSIFPGIANSLSGLSLSSLLGNTNSVPSYLGAPTAPGSGFGLGALPPAGTGGPTSGPFMSAGGSGGPLLNQWLLSNLNGGG